MSNLYVGCAVWSFPGWQGDIFPAGTRSKKYLSFYSRYFPAVEGNTTFYAVPEEKVIDRWKAETPDGFRFCLKLPRDFTHSGLLLPQLYKSIDFLDLVSKLEDKLAMVFIQLPPKYNPDYWDDLAEYLTGLADIGVPLALEVRNPEWFERQNMADLQELLAQLGIDLVILDTQPIYQTPSDPDFPFICKKPNVPLITEITGNKVLIRYVSHPRSAINEPFMRAWAERLQPLLLAGKEVYLFVHCPMEDLSPTNARLFQKILREQEIEVHDLPWQEAEPEAVSQLALDL
jgi:uncharacterized protein YecE (DUF72 family)